MLTLGGPRAQKAGCSCGSRHPLSQDILEKPIGRLVRWAFSVHIGLTTS